MASWEDEADDLLQEAERERQESSAAAAAAEAKQKEAEKQKESRRNKRGGGGGAAAAATGGGGDTSSAAVDALAEKLRQQKIVEDEDRRLMDDLFAGCERPADYVAPSSAAAAAKSKDAAAAPAAAAKTRRGGAAAGGSAGDALDSVPLRSYKDLEDFALRLGRHIQMSPAKSPAWLRFLDLIISDCASQMELKDLVSLQHKLQAKIAAKEKQVNQLAEKKKKPTTFGGNIRNYKDEMDLVYGDLSSEEEERDDEEEG